MKKSIVLFCSVIMGISFFASLMTPAQAAPQQERRGMFGRHCVSRWQMIKFMRDLDITEQQKDDLHALAKEMDNQTRPLAADIKELQQEMEETFLAAEIDNATAQGQIDEMLALQNQLAGIFLQAQLEAAGILTAEQRSLVLEMIGEIRECARSQHDWMSLQKPRYFSLLMPDNKL